MKPGVAQEVARLQERYPGCVAAEELPDGGAQLEVSGRSLLGGPYLQEETWCGFTITFAHPYADIYPMFVRADLARKDGRGLGQSCNPGNSFYGKPAVMLSRRTKLVNTEHPMDAGMKMEKVLQWLISL
jgi:hypothetical protein